MWWIVFHSAQKLRSYALVGNKKKVTELEAKWSSANHINMKSC
jgi:hypothetical protein